MGKHSKRNYRPRNVTFKKRKNNEKIRSLFSPSQPAVQSQTAAPQATATQQANPTNLLSRVKNVFSGPTKIRIPLNGRVILQIGSQILELNDGIVSSSSVNSPLQPILAASPLQDQSLSPPVNNEPHHNVTSTISGHEDYGPTDAMNNRLG